MEIKVSNPSRPTSYLDGISSLAVTGLQPQIITGIFLQVLREHFISADRIENEYLKGCVWVAKDDDPVTPDPERTKILIDPIYRWNRTLTQKRPGIIVKRGAQQPQRVGIGMNRTFGLGAEDLPEAGSKYSLFYQGSHSMLCVATDGGVAEILSTEVARHLTQFAPVIRKEFRFKEFELVQLGEIGVLEEEKENYVVPVVIKYSYENNWRLTKQEPRLKSVVLKS
jgi:hypothetical protein